MSAWRRGGGPVGRASGGAPARRAVGAPRALSLTLLLLWATACGQEAAPTTTSGSGPDALTSVTGEGLHFEVSGQGPAVVFIHGAGLDSRMWDPQVALLAPRFRTLRYDVRGFGRSPPATEPYSHVEDLCAVLDAAGVELASIVGLSLGGGIALGFALLYPERVERLLLIAPAVPGAQVAPEEPERFQRIGRLAQEARTLEAVEEWLGSAHMTPAMENPEIAPRVRELAQANHLAWRPGLASPIPVMPPVSQRLHEVRAPTSILVGERDDAGARELAALAAEGIPGSRIERLPDVGHVPNLEARQEVERWLLRELSRNGQGSRFLRCDAEGLALKRNSRQAPQSSGAGATGA